MEPIVSTQWLAEWLGESGVIAVDVRWYPNKPGGGRAAYEAQRIAGAVRLDLDDDLADRSDPGLLRGRHPLPDAGRFADRLADVGIGVGTTVVAYDDAWGSIAARLWWMMRWIGHGEAAVLDGGIKKWVAEGRGVESGPAGRPARHPQPIKPQVDDSMVLATKGEVAAALAAGWLVLDARSAERFRGEVEPIDKHAGRIRGAHNAPFTANLTGEEIRVFRSPAELRALYAMLGVTPGRDVACSCGSGVSACHDILAMVSAGFAMPRLYPGSWSEWSLDPAMPTAKGPATD